MLIEKINEKLKSSSQAQLAKELGCSQTFICRMAKGDHMPSIENLSALSEKLGVPLTEAIKEIQANKAKVKKEKAAG